MGFYGSPLNPMSLTCGLITVEATPGKESGKEAFGRAVMFQRGWLQQPMWEEGPVQVP